MQTSFLLVLRESLTCALLLMLAVSYPAFFVRRRAIYAGALGALCLGCLLVFSPSLDSRMPGLEHWISARYITEAIIFYSGLVLLALLGPVGRKSPKETGKTALEGSLYAFLFLLGFSLLFFEARISALFLRDHAMAGGGAGVGTGVALGLAMGLAPLIVLDKKLPALETWRIFSPASLLVALGAIKFLVGGVGEVEGGDILMSFQTGMQYLVENMVSHSQALLMIKQHQFISAPLSGLADYLREDRLSTALTVAFAMVPPVLVMVRVFSRPDPEVEGIAVPAERRLRIAFFRREMVMLSAPVLAAFVLLVVSLHAVNASVNPLSEPEPMPVMESEEEAGWLIIPLTDKIGDFTDAKLRKYVFYSGNDRIIFLAIMKPDGTIGLALDECEICKPAEWNTSALGYAQRGEHLVCKYCMSPIAVPSVNEPGGCNPIPVPFGVGEDNVRLAIDDLVRVHEAAQELDKKGTHF